MKLAEALVLRKDTKKRLEQLRERLKLSALVQEGEEPPEDPQVLLAEVQRLLEQMTALIQSINLTNLETTLPDGRTLADALAERDTLSLYFNILDTTATAATPKFERANRSEIKKVSTIKVADIRRQMDDIAQQRRELDTLIQSANWTTDLMGK